jgi:hypothetical protein
LVKHSPKKDRKKEEKGGEKEEAKDSSFKGFLKKRAPLYGLILTAFVIFLVPELTGGSINDHLGTLDGPEGQALEILKNYDGPNDEGLKLIDALDEQLNSAYSDEKIFDHDETSSKLVVILKSGEDSVFEISWSFITYRETIDYLWSVNIDSGDVTSDNAAAKTIVDIVDYYD